ILVVDIGGTHVKLLRSARDSSKFDSGSALRPDEFVRKFKDATRRWNYDALSIGFPSPVHRGQIIKEPKHLGKGWIGFDFAKALSLPITSSSAAASCIGSINCQKASSAAKTQTLTAAGFAYGKRIDPANQNGACCRETRQTSNAQRRTSNSPF